MTIVNTLQGEYQITNGYGPDRAPQVMQVIKHLFVLLKQVKAKGT